MSSPKSRRYPGGFSACRKRSFRPTALLAMCHCEPVPDVTGCGERSERRQWRKKQGERVAAVKIGASAIRQRGNFVRRNRDIRNPPALPPSPAGITHRIPPYTTRSTGPLPGPGRLVFSFPYIFFGWPYRPGYAAAPCSPPGSPSPAGRGTG